MGYIVQTFYDYDFILFSLNCWRQKKEMIFYKLQIVNENRCPELKRTLSPYKDNFVEFRMHQGRKWFKRLSAYININEFVCVLLFYFVT